MKDLALGRLIPLATGAVLTLGCGGRAETDGTSSSDHFPNGDPAQADPDDPEQYDAALEALTSDFCKTTIHCAEVENTDPSDYFDTADECSEFLLFSVERQFDLEDSDCRKQLLQVFDCINSATGCSYGDRYDACEQLNEQFTRHCYRGDLYDDEYDY